MLSAQLAMVRGGNSQLSINERPRRREFILVPLLYFLGAKAGVILTVMPEGMAIFWPPNGILLAALIRFRGRGYLLLAALILGAEVAADVPTFHISEALLFGLNNIAEATMAYALLLRWQFNPQFVSLGDLVKFVLFGPIIAAFFAACFGASIYIAFRGTESSYLEFLRIWWFGDALGLMILTPMLLSWWIEPIPGIRSSAPIRFYDGLVGLGALIVLGLLVISRDGMLLGIHVSPVLLLPIVVYLAARFNVAMITMVISAMVFVILVLTTRGQNPFGVMTSRDAVIHAFEEINRATPNEAIPADYGDSCHTCDIGGLQQHPARASTRLPDCNSPKYADLRLDAYQATGCANRHADPAAAAGGRALVFKDCP